MIKYLGWSLCVSAVETNLLTHNMLTLNTTWPHVTLTCHLSLSHIWDFRKFIVYNWTWVCQNLKWNTPVTSSNSNHVVLTPLADVCRILGSTGGIRRRHGRLNRCGWEIWKKGLINTSLRSYSQCHLLVPLLAIISPLQWKRMMATVTVKNKTIKKVGQVRVRVRISLFAIWRQSRRAIPWPRNRLL